MLPTMILVSEVMARLDANPFDPSSVMVETRHVLKAIDIVALLINLLAILNPFHAG